MKRIIFALVFAIGCGEATVERTSQLNDIRDTPVFAGEVVHEPGFEYNQVMGEWIVPSLGGPSGDGWAQWVGLGGAFDGIVRDPTPGSNCQMRLGTIAPINGTRAFIWYQGSGDLLNLAVSPGQRVQAILWSYHGETAYYKITNTATGAYAQGNKNPPVGTSCTWHGDSAQWIAERPVISNSRRALAQPLPGAGFTNDHVWNFYPTYQEAGPFVHSTTELMMINSSTVLMGVGLYNSMTRGFSFNWAARQ